MISGTHLRDRAAACIGYPEHGIGWTAEMVDVQRPCWTMFAPQMIERLVVSAIVLRAPGLQIGVLYTMLYELGQHALHTEAALPFGLLGCSRARANYDHVLDIQLGDGARDERAAG